MKKADMAKRLAVCLAAGAGATGTAQAGIVYTPGPFDTGYEGTINIDFDGMNGPEFSIQHDEIKIVVPLDGNLSILGDTDGSDQGYIGDLYGVADLYAGVEIGPTAPLGSAWSTVFPGDVDAGQFDNLGRYVGVRFTLPSNGYATYGWVEMQEYDGGGTLGHDNQGRVLGYAYQTDGSSIIAGDIGSVGAVPEPSTWLLLASGCAGIAALRRRRKG